MNAQEAIERMERKLTADKNRLDSYKSNGRYDGYEKFEEDIQALSIVLESAKLFHSGEPEEGPHYYYFDGWHVRKDGLPKIGVYPEGADE